MLHLDNVSTETKIGKILLFIGLVLKAISVLSMLIFGTAIALLGINVPHLVTTMGPLVVIIMLVGIALGYIALRFADESQMPRASVIALVGSVLPPVDLLYIVAGILFMVSKEANS